MGRILQGIFRRSLKTSRANGLREGGVEGRMDRAGRAAKHNRRRRAEKEEREGGARMGGAVLCRPLKVPAVLRRLTSAAVAVLVLVLAVTVWHANHTGKFAKLTHRGVRLVCKDARVRTRTHAAWLRACHALDKQAIS